MLIIGKSGRLAQTFARALGAEAHLIGRDELDLGKPESLPFALGSAAKRRPGARPILINTAAFTNVDAAESAREEAHVVNAEAPAVMAKWAHENGHSFIHYSTDYVYSGEGESPWREEEAADPVNHYGRTKLEGDLRVAQACAQHLTFRTTWLYGQGENFPRFLLKLAGSRDLLQVVRDQVGGPTYMEELVRCSLAAISQATLAGPGAPWGTYNLVNSGFVSKFEFAKRCVELAHRHGLIEKAPRVEAVESSFFPSPARRPANSRLSLEKFRAAFGLTPDPWEKSLEDWLRSERASSQPK